jgi:uncharacterized membrane protein YbhN (UPF0104 family)
VAVLAGVIAVCALVLHGIDWRRFWATLATTRIGLVALAVGAFAGHELCRAERFHLMLPPGRPGRLSTYYSYIVAVGTGLVAPAGSGEALRVWLLKRRHGVPVPWSVAVTLLDKLFEIAGLMLVATPLPFLLPLPLLVSLAIVVIAAGATATVVLLARQGWLERFRLWRSLAPGLACLGDHRLVLALSALSLAGHLCTCVMCYLVMIAVGLHLPLATVPLTVVMGGIAFAVPLVPGQIGTFEAAVVGAVRFAGGTTEPALACALLAHVIQKSHAVFALAGLQVLVEARAEKKAPRQ